MASEDGGTNVRPSGPPSVGVRSRVRALRQLAQRSSRALRPEGAVLHALTLTGGTAASQMVLMGASLLLTRIYTPEQVGVFSTVFGVVSLLAAAATFSYQFAIPLAQDDHEAVALTWLTLLLGTTGAALLAPVGAQWLALIVPEGTHSLVQGILLVFALTMSLVLWTALRALLARWSRFKAIGVSGFLEAVTQACSQLLLGLVGFGASGLAAGFAAGKIANVGGLLWAARRRISRWEGSLGALAVRWRRFPILVTIPTLLNLCIGSAIGPFAAALYGASFAGFLALATRVLSAPAALLGQAVATVFMPRSAELLREGRHIRAEVERTCTGLLAVALAAYAPVVVLGPQLFAWVFGAEWERAGTVAVILAPWLVLGFISSPVSSLAMVHDRLGQLFVIQVVATVAMLGGLSVGIPLENSYAGLVGFSLAGSLIYLAYLAWILRLAGSSLMVWYSAIWRAPTLVLVLALLPWLVKGLLPTGAYWAVVAVALVSIWAMMGIAVKRLISRSSD